MLEKRGMFVVLDHALGRLNATPGTPEGIHTKWAQPLSPYLMWLDV